MTEQERGASTGFLDRLVWDTAAQVLAPSIRFDDERVIDLHLWIGGQVRIEATGRLRCTHCSRPTRKSFGQGYCYPCFRKLAQCDLCIVSPTRCHRAEGTCREPEWADGFCMAPHSVYLANSSGLKVGLTRAGNEARRWADQGAVQGLVLAHCDTRLVAGQLEASIAEIISDRTNWRRLIRAPADAVDLETAAAAIREQVPMAVEGVRWAADSVRTLNYPVLNYGPVKSMNFDKSPTIEGHLLGVKGQYVLLDIGAVNLRRHTGYELRWELRSPPQDSPVEGSW
ncbi:MAG: DUF2797 domain-containing protein [Pseudomonadota bacterium]